MNCPKCDHLSNLMREEIRELDFDDMSLSTTCEYFCPKCQSTFTTIYFYEIRPEEELIIERDEDN